MSSAATFSPATIARIKAGMVCFILSGVLTTIGLYLRGPVIDQSLHPEAFVESALSPTHIAAWSLLLPNLTVQLFAWMALWAFLSKGPLERLAFWGMVCSIIGNCVFAPAIGIQAFAAPEIGRLYSEGMTEVISVAQAGLGSPFALVFLAGSAPFLVIGSVLVGVVLWKAPQFPKWTAVVYIWHSIALTVFVPISYPLEFSGGVALLAVAIALSVAVWRELGPARAG